MIEKDSTFLVTLILGCIVLGVLSGILFKGLVSVILGAGMGGSLWTYILLEFFSSEKLFYGNDSD